ncbi:hypothetical protein [Encephalitozoon cuniculi GB-M1]|uniref:Uncharacterized protein n=1 Tax=Encephalitozoon cuniculi (strain GB-M1) TaxID=284813 RepID=Q8STU3_ENCCU|nr:uncharacterized protein ECU09_0620 [Encephalitozoon cuniculi GB-M1]CAD27034.1 hypothetical protein [Encephalitozoon cuniculi GB-M1]
MAGFYERIRETWNSIRNTLRLGQGREQCSYEELCSRFGSERAIEVDELDHIKELCKAIAEPQCGKKIDDGFEVLKRIAVEKAEERAGVKRKRERDEEEVRSEKRSKKYRRRGYQRKYALRKEDDVSWGILPKKYRVEGKTPTETVEKAISYDAEDNLFLHLGEVSTDEESEYFCERNVKRLNSGEVENKVICNFGEEYNCKKCVEYEIRKEYEAREGERRREEKERAERRKKMARDRWESRVPRSYFYLEKDLGVDRTMARYVTDDKFDIDDLEETERERLVRVLNQARKDQLFDIEKIGSKRVSFDENKNEVSEVWVPKVNSEENSNDVEPRLSGNMDIGRDGIDAELRTNNDTSRSTLQPCLLLEPTSEVEENASDGIRHSEGSGDATSSKMPVCEEVLNESATIEEEGVLAEGKKDEEKEPKRFGFWDGRTPSVQEDTPVFQFGSGSPFPTQDSPSTVNHENISSPFASDLKAPETGGFVFGGGPSLQPHPSGTQGPLLDSPVPGSSLLKRKLSGSGEVIQGPGAGISFSSVHGKSAFPATSDGMITETQSFPLFNNTGPGQAEGPQRADSIGSVGNIFSNGKSLFSGLFEGTVPSQQPAKPSIGYTDPNEKNEGGLSGLFGSGIFNATDDDPFERSRLDRRR